MTQPTGFLGPTVPSHVCKLQKSLYGLKQAPRARFTRQSNHLLHLGFTGSKNDSSLFIWHHELHTLLILIYVDDIILAGSHQEDIDCLMWSLHKDFAIKDLGPLHYFLRVEVTKIGPNLHLSQSKYIWDLLIKSKMDGAKPSCTPIVSKNALS